MSPITSKSAADLVCVQLEVHIWSGRRLLDKTDLIHANPEFAKLPEKDLANLGSVKICNPEQIKQFQKLKNKAEAVLARAGLPILGAIGVPTGKYAVVHKELEDIKVEYDKRVSAFIAGFDAAISDWKIQHLLAHPEWTSLFKDLPSAAYVLSRLSFKFHPYKIAAPADESRPGLNEYFNNQVGGLKGELIQEVAKEASSFVASLSAQSSGGSVAARDFVTPKTLGPLKRAAQKLSAFAFVDQEIGPLADMLDDMLSAMPDVGRIEGKQLVMLGTIGSLLTNPRGIADLSAHAFRGGTAEDVSPSAGKFHVVPSHVALAMQTAPAPASPPAAIPSVKVPVAPQVLQRPTAPAAVAPAASHESALIVF